MKKFIEVNSKYNKIKKYLWVLCLNAIACFSSFAEQKTPQQILFHADIDAKAKTELIIPFPQNTVALASNIKLFEQDIEIDVQSEVVNVWPSITNKKYIRLLKLSFSHFGGKNIKLLLKFSKSQTTLPMSKIAIGSNTQLVYPSSRWLAQSILLHPEDAIRNADWYIKPQQMYANYIVDDRLLLANGYPYERYSQWLYDRPQSLYQLFIMTDEKRWLHAANKALFYYIDNLTEVGEFIPVGKNDIKYLMPKGALYRFLLTGDGNALLALEKIYRGSLNWNSNYKTNSGFWTERNQAAALNSAVSLWEATGRDDVKQRIDQIIDDTIEMTFFPENNWPLVGCPQHSFKSHEGWGDSSPACSPWMMALLADSLWRYYRLTEDKRSAALLEGFGDFILNYGIFYGTEGKLKGSIVPKYLVSIKNPKQEELEQWADSQHTCDIAALLGKSVFIKEQFNRSDLLVRELFNVFVSQCQWDYEKFKNKKKKTTSWAVKPPRKFSWWYSTTSDLPWLADKILSK